MNRQTGNRTSRAGSMKQQQKLSSTRLQPFSGIVSGIVSGFRGSAGTEGEHGPVGVESRGLWDFF
eukprot:751750-Hanusia_phi.AAC.1